MCIKKNYLSLLHLANFNSTNVGNGALINGLEKTISEDFASKVIWKRLPWDDYTFQKKDFDKKFVDEVNNSDGLIVGGAVTFNGREYNHRTGTRFELPFELWNNIKKPVIFYGLSYRNWPNQKYFHLDKLKDFVKKSLEKDNFLISLRNDGTKSWLEEKIGIYSKEIYEVPDSAVFVDTKKNINEEIKVGKKNIIISVNDEDSFFRYKEKPEIYRKNLIKNLSNFLESIIDIYDCNIILCPHYFDDYKLIVDLIEDIKPKFAHQNLITSGLSRAKDAASFYSKYLNADLAISMRVHSMSPCIGMGVPMIPLTTQTRMVKFLENNELIDLNVDAFDKELVKKLLNKIEEYFAKPKLIKEKLSEARFKMRLETKAFNKKIEDHISLYLN